MLICYKQVEKGEEGNKGKNLSPFVKIKPVHIFSSIADV